MNMSSSEVFSWKMYIMDFHDYRLFRDIFKSSFIKGIRICKYINFSVSKYSKNAGNPNIPLINYSGFYYLAKKLQKNVSDRYKFN